MLVLSLASLTMATNFDAVWVGDMLQFSHGRVPHIRFLLWSREPGKVEMDVAPAVYDTVPDDVKHVTVYTVREVLKKNPPTTFDFLKSVEATLSTCLDEQKLSDDWRQVTSKAVIMRHRNLPLELIFGAGKERFFASIRTTRCDDKAVIRGLGVCAARCLAKISARTDNEAYTPWQMARDMDEVLRGYGPLEVEEAAAQDSTDLLRGFECKRVAADRKEA